jgi:CheY-like chemotaxis protein
MAGLVAIAALASIESMAPLAIAQEAAEQDPFGTQPPAEQPADAAADADPQDGAAAGPVEAAPAIDPSQYGPAVRAILERERTTPEQLLEGILLLIEFDEAELARPWLDQLIAANPDADVQAQLARQFGSHRLLRLASAAALGEPAREVAMSYLNAHAAQVRDPARLGQLIEQLADPSVDAQYVAISGLVEAGDAAAVALVAALDDASSDRHREAMQVALAELAPLSFGPLLAGLSARDADAQVVRAASARVLGRIAPPHLAVWLLEPSLDADPSADHARQHAALGLERMIGRAPTRELAERLLQETLARHLEQQIPLDTDENGQVNFWYWDTTANAPAMAKLNRRDAHLHYASDLANDLLSLRPDRVEYLTQATMLRMAVPDLEGSQEDFLLPAEMAPQVLLGAMDLALEYDLPQAIAAAARKLRELPPDERLLLGRAPAESPLVAALAHPSRGVRWEALSTIMTIDPSSPYPGASRVMQSLAEFLQAGTRPRAVVALPILEKGQTIAAAVEAQGYDVELATQGREAIMAAAAQGGADLVLVDARIDRPPLREVLYQVHAHPSSAGALIGILGVGEGLEHGRKVARDHETAAALPHPQNDEDVVAAIERLRQLAADENGRAGLPGRDEMSRQALAWLGEIAARKDTFYDVRKYEAVVLQAIAHDAQAAVEAGILASFPSQRSQLRLVDLASSRVLPIAQREKAAEAFRTNVERFGVQLTTSDILAQYDRYNASETADRPTQAVLGHVLDTIEAGKGSRAVGQ